MKKILPVLVMSGLLLFPGMSARSQEDSFKIISIDVSVPQTGNAMADQISRIFTITFSKPATNVRLSITEKGKTNESASVSIPTKISAQHTLTVDNQINLERDTTYIYLISGSDALNSSSSAMDTGEFTTSRAVSQSARSGPITITLTPSKTLAKSGEAIALTWDAPNADYCTASGGWSGKKDPKGSEQMTIQKTALFALQCFNSTDQPSIMVDVIMETSASAPTFSTFKASKPSIARGESTVLSWNVQAQKCQSYTNPLEKNGDWGFASGGEWDMSAGERSLSGSQTVTPERTTRYWLNCFNNEKQTMRSVIVAVDGTRPKAEGPALSLARVKVVSQGDELTKQFSYDYGNSPADGSLRQTLVVTKKSTGELIARKDIVSDPLKGPSGFAVLSGFEPETEYHYRLDIEDPSDGRTASQEGDFKTGNNAGDPRESDDQVESPYIVFVRFPDMVTRGKPAMLRWESDGEYCIASGGWKGKKKPTGSLVVYPTKAKTKYYLQCFNEQVKSQKEVAIISVVKKLPPKKQGLPKIEFQASDLTVAKDEQVTLTWNAKNAMNCEASGPDDWTGLLYASGDQDVMPEETSEYSIKCWNRHGKSATSRITLSVND